MILPNVRMSFGRDEAAWLLRCLGEIDAGRTGEDAERLAERGIDALLDDPRTLECVLQPEGPGLVPPRLAVYVLVRHALLESRIESRLLADYLAALILEFGREDRAQRIADDDRKRYAYLVDILADLSTARGRRAFLLHAHLGNFSLWLSGLFPDYIETRRRRKGGPDLGYFESVGRTGFEVAARSPHARGEMLDEVYRHAADAFPEMRQALNRFSDRHLFPRPASPVERLLRQVSTRFRLHEGG